MFLTICLLLLIIFLLYVIVRLLRDVSFLFNYVRPMKKFLNNTKSKTINQYNNQRFDQKLDAMERFDLQSIEIKHDGVFVRGDIIYIWDRLNHYTNVEKNARKLVYYKMLERKLLLNAKLRDIEANIKKLEENTVGSVLEKYYAKKSLVKTKYKLECMLSINRMKLELYNVYKNMEYDPDDQEFLPMDEVDN